MHRLTTVAISTYLVEELDKLIGPDGVYENRTKAMNAILDEYIKRYKMAKVSEENWEKAQRTGEAG